MYSTRIPCSSATACIVAQSDGTPMVVVVLMVATISAILNLHVWNQTKQIEDAMEIHSEITPGKEIIIDIPALQKTPEVQDTSCYAGGTSPKMKIKVKSNEIAATTDQSNLDISEADSIIHQSLIAGQETSSFHIEHTNNLLPEAQTTSGIQNNNSGATSQTPQQPAQPTTAAESHAEVPELKTAIKVALLVISISVGGIFSVVAGLIEDNNTGITHKVLFKAYVSLSYISFFSGVILFLLTLMPPRFPHLLRIVKITMWITLGSITYAIGCATCVILLKSLVEVVFVLVAPLAVVFVLIILSFSSATN